ncbi:MAG: RluA family pseudouridine synthase [Myxococcota bacterium]|nr:RluA family pseudouridine synthase [Myxococcota bacterium]
MSSPTRPSAPVLEYTVPSDSTIRLDAYCLQVFAAIYTRSQAKKWIKSGHILLNSEAVSPAYFPKLGDRITLCSPKSILPKYALSIPVHFEDDHMAVVFKPAGLHVSGNYPRTLRRALRHNLQPSAIPYPLPQPEPAHRLDRRTSGLLLIAKTPVAIQALGDDFANQRIKKRYRALVLGKASDGGSREDIDEKTALTQWKVVFQNRSLHTDFLTELDVFPHTGRTHQIRKHLARSGHPILGDDLYHNGLVRTDKGLFLSAVGISFLHPVLRTEHSFQIDPPNKFARYREREERRFRTYHQEKE